jgi:hypothetical protein
MCDIEKLMLFKFCYYLLILLIEEVLTSIDRLLAVQ